MIMSINICPRCMGKSIIVDNPTDTTQYLCVGCEIEMYAELHAVMNRYGIDKESAYKHLKANMAYCDVDQDNSSMKELTGKHRRMTNADRIRSFSDDELAEFIEQVSTDSMETISFGTKEYEEIWEHKETALQWLQSEVEE